LKIKVRKEGFNVKIDLQTSSLEILKNLQFARIKRLFNLKI